jgi:hypothetical protein
VRSGKISRICGAHDIQGSVGMLLGLSFETDLFFLAVHARNEFNIWAIPEAHNR